MKAINSEIIEIWTVWKVIDRQSRESSGTTREPLNEVLQ